MERVKSKVATNIGEVENGVRVSLGHQREERGGEKEKREVNTGVERGSGNFPSSLHSHSKPSLAQGLHLSRPPLQSSSKRENMETAFAERLQELAAVMAMDARSSGGGVKEDKEKGEELEQGEKKEEEKQRWVAAGSFHVDEKMRRRKERTLNNWVIYQRVAALVMGARSTVIKSRERIAKENLEGRILRLEKRGQGKADATKAGQGNAKVKSKAYAPEEKFSEIKLAVQKAHPNMNLLKEKSLDTTHKSSSKRTSRISIKSSVASAPSERGEKGSCQQIPKAIYKLLLSSHLQFNNGCQSK